MKIAFIISTLSHGGAERVASILVNQWVVSSNDVYLLTFESPGTIPFYTIDKRVELRQLDVLFNNKNFFHSIYNNLRRVRKIISEVDNIQPDVIISFMVETNILSILAARYSNIPVVVSERVHPMKHRIGILRKYVRKLVYPFADAVVVQSEEIAKWVRKYISKSCRVLANPVDLERFTKSHNNSNVFKKENIITAVGRLERQKGFDVLVEAFNRIYRRFPNWQLEIYGSGSEEHNLLSLIKMHGLKEKVFLRGMTSDIAQVFRRTDIFVSASRFEGYPNAVLEALASGCCVIATDCPGASREILQDGKYGVLISQDSPDEMADALAGLMEDDTRRQGYADNAQNAVSMLNAHKVAEQWLDIFRQLTLKKM